MKDLDSIGARIRKARKDKNLTLSDVREATGLSTGNLSELENNKFMPSAGALISLKNLFEVSVDWLLTGEDPYSESFPETEYSADENSSFVKESSQSYLHLGKEEKLLLDGFRKITPERRRDIMGFIEVCKANAKK